MALETSDGGVAILMALPSSRDVPADRVADDILTATDHLSDSDYLAAIDHVAREHTVVWPSSDEPHAAHHRTRCAEMALDAKPKHMGTRAPTSANAKDLVATLAGWIRRTPDDVQKFLEDHADDFVIAGGFPTHVYTTYACAGAAANFPSSCDVDVFVFDAIDFTTCKQAWFDVFPKVSEEDIWISCNSVCDTLAEIYVQDPDTGERLHTIQINSVCSGARGIDDVLMSFDRASCAFAYDARKRAIVSTAAAVVAHESNREPVDLVVGSGDAITCLRVGARDFKYAARYGIRVTWPEWARSIETFLRDRTLRPAIEEISRVRLAIACLRNVALVKCDITMLAARFDAEVVEILSTAPRGLITTIAIRKILAPETIGIVDQARINGSFYLSWNRSHTKGRSDARFVSRAFGRPCAAVVRMPGIQTLMDDVYAWRAIATRLARACTEVARAIGEPWSG